MAENDAAVSELARAVLDGTSIDWGAAKTSADESSRPLVEQLQILSNVADVHRRSHAEAAPITTLDDAGGALDSWGHLRVLERIDRGAFGEVYRAWDTRLDREVALKLLPADRAPDERSSTAIIEEGRLLARVHHPNVVTIYGAEQIGTTIGLWMEYVRGRTLKQIVADGRVFTEAEAVETGVELCRAVAAVHSAGLLHRDIKAQNVMLADDGRTVLMDFGTGRELVNKSSSDLAGTPLYLAPEILDGHAATIQSDIYSLGVLLFYLVTGSYPVRAENLRDLRHAHERNDRTQIRAAGARADLSPRFARVIERSIDPQPEQRYRSVDEFAADLSALKRHPNRTSLPYAIAITAAVILIGGLGWEVVGRHLARTADARPFEQPVIAVLPFKNLSAEPANGDFVDGLTDEIIRNLAVIQGLQVRSRTSSFAFKDKPRNIREIGGQLGVNLVVEGSVLRSGDRLRVNAQLIQVPGDVLLWSDRFDRDLKDVFVIQDDISRAIVNKLRLTLGRGQRRYDTDVQAYELYLKGRALIDKRGVPSLEKAAELFEQVITKDPTFAPAYAGLANAYALMSLPIGSSLPYVTLHSILRPAAVKAQELDPLLADAEEAMGWLYAVERDWPNAEAAFQRAIELNPSLSEIATGYSASTLRALGKYEEALRILRTAQRSDPLSLDVQREIGAVQVLAGRDDEAIDTLQRVHAIEPNFPFVESWLGRALMFGGRVDEAIPVLGQTDGRNLGRLKAVQTTRNPLLATAYVMAGRRADAEKLLALHQGSASARAVIETALGNKDRAFEALEEMAAVEPHHVAFFLVFPEVSALRGDPRFAALRKRFNLPN